MHILLVEDEEELAGWLDKALRSGGLTLTRVGDAAGALRVLAAQTFDAIILDLGLPDRDGLALLTDIRQRNDRTPVLILTAQGALSDRVRGLRYGADDFMVKPFALSELEARLIALVRRARGSGYPRLRCGGLLYDVEADVYTLAGRPLPLTRREQAALYILMQNSGRPVKRADLFQAVFEQEATESGADAVEVVVHRLRKKLDESVRLTTVRGLGYMLDAGDAASA